MNKAQVGKRGEQIAARFLKKHGYEILEKNLHISHQEIDIIAVNHTHIAFVEVKTRVKDPNDADYLSTPAAAVTYEKQQHLLHSAKRYLSEHSYNDLQPRMDVIEVYLAPDTMIRPIECIWERISSTFFIPQRKALHINHIENAFGLYGYRP